MKNIFKAEGFVISEIKTPDVKNVVVKGDIKKDEYINYDNGYVSFTRLDYTQSSAVVLPYANPGQLVGGFINGYVIQITGKTIYENIVYQNDCMSRGRAINNFNERSDLYTFTLPTFFISGGTKIQTGTTTASTGVYIVDTLSSLTFNAIFSANNIYDLFFVNSNGIKFELYQRVNQNNYSFSPNSILNTEYFVKNNFSSYLTSYSSVTFTYDLSSYEGEFLIKGLYKWKNFTYFGNLVGLNYYENNGFNLFPYALYNSERDYYFIYLKRAEKPQIFSNTIQSTTLPLFVYSITPSCDGQTGFPLPTNSLSISTNSLLVTVNGIVLSTSEYYYSGGTLYIDGGTILSTDTITIVSSNDINTPPIYTESYQITTIPNTTYPSVGQKVIYNTDTNKYEYWLDYNTTNQPVITVNGQVLSNGIDFYVSSSNSRRMIFEGTLVVGDIITAFYNSIMKGNNFITTNQYTLYWSIPNAPLSSSGYFLVELANYGDTNFNNPVFSGIALYSEKQTSYSINMYFSGGTYGQKYLSKVTNYKNYYTLLGELIQTNNSSDVITLTIGTNALNNY